MLSDLGCNDPLMIFAGTRRGCSEAALCFAGSPESRLHALFLCICLDPELPRSFGGKAEENNQKGHMPVVRKELIKFIYKTNYRVNKIRQFVNRGT